MHTINKIRRNKYSKTILVSILIAAIVIGFVGSGFILNTDMSVMVVESSSMSIPYNTQPGPPYPIEYIMLTLQHPFDQTLNVGDIIIVQGIDPESLNTDYPNSDIIVYTRPTHLDYTPIVHRIVTSYEKNGTLYFETKGDGNGDKWPATPTKDQYDSNAFWNTGEGVPADLVKGKVILRIPCFGWITLLLKGIYDDHPWILPLIILLIVLLVVAEFVRPLIKRKKT